MIKVYNNLENIEFDENTIVTVGTFDGVHLGHKEILNRLLSFKSKNRTCIVTFHPHPQHILGNKSINLKLLTSINERIWLFNEMGIDSSPMGILRGFYFCVIKIRICQSSSFYAKYIRQRAIEFRSIITRKVSI